MAQRCIIVKVARPEYSATWEEDTIALIESRRWEIIGDLLAILKEPVKPLARHSRWGAWEDAVLAHVAEPAACQRAIVESQAEVDDDRAQAVEVARAFEAELRWRGHDPGRELVWVPAAEAAKVLNGALGEKEKYPTNKAGVLLGTLGISMLRRNDRGGWGRGWLWTGREVPQGAKVGRMRPEPPCPHNNWSSSATCPRCQASRRGQ
jgi:hypothetical protein